MRKIGTVTFKQWPCDIFLTTYCVSNAPALTLHDSLDKEPVAKATVNLPDVALGKNEVLIKDYAENEGMLACLVNAGIVRDTDRTIPTGFVNVHVCELLVS